MYEAFLKEEQVKSKKAKVKSMPRRRRGLPTPVKLSDYFNWPKTMPARQNFIFPVFNYQSF